MSDFPSVTIVIAAAAAAETLPAALRSVRAQDYPGPIEVVVAAADPETAVAVGDAADLVVDNPTGDTPAGLNRAIAAGTGEIVVRVDAHSELPSDYVSALVGLLDATKAENVGGRQVPMGKTFMERAIAAAMSSRFGAGDARYRVGGSAGPTDTVYLGAFRRSTLDDLGGYDERFKRHQDYELNQRIRASGGTVWFDPSIAVTYRPRSSLLALGSQYFQYGRWKRVFARRHPDSLRPRQMAPPILVAFLAIAFLVAIWWPMALVAPATYLIALLLIGLVSSLRIGAPALAMPPALAVMHLSWGAGFLLSQSNDR
ncbi:MAG: glycosyltransferase family 2 protein [Acidimicrobiia bacterium]